MAPIFGEYKKSFSKSDSRCQQLCSFEYFHPVLKDESIAVLHPEWDKLMDQYNGDIRADIVSPWSSVKLWWRCPKCGGFYPASPLEKMRGMGCWHCENRCVLIGFNDFKTTHPDLEKKYSKKNNIPSYARIFAPYDSVMWICDRCGGTAQATFREAERKHGILYCYSCKKEMASGRDISDRNNVTKPVPKIINSNPDFKLIDLMNRYRGDKK